MMMLFFNYIFLWWIWDSPVLRRNKTKPFLMAIYSVLWKVKGFTAVPDNPYVSGYDDNLWTTGNLLWLKWACAYLHLKTGISVGWCFICFENCVCNICSFFFQYRATTLPAFKYYVTCACLIFFCIFVVQILVLPK